MSKRLDKYEERMAERIAEAVVRQLEERGLVLRAPSTRPAGEKNVDPKTGRTRRWTDEELREQAERAVDEMIKRRPKKL